MRTEPYLIKGGVVVDDRGRVTFCNGFDMTPVKRFYYLENHSKGFVRAWHGHRREAKWITVLSGSAIIATAKMYGDELTVDRNEVRRYIMHNDGSVLYVPGGYANGHKSLVTGTVVMHFSNMTMDETQDDDVRFSWLEHGDVWRVRQR